MSEEMTCTVCGYVGNSNDYHPIGYCMIRLKERLAQCEMERNKLLEACEMGSKALHRDGPALLKWAASIVINCKGAYCMDIAIALRHKAAAEKAALKAAKGEEG